ncbi:UBX domain-containing protein 4 [Calliphora vicina]|uniref:UBX domain-containing protein 4 n=1 Tax=Calliphora vicina TaxID=7373 RepID=UPI00325BA459
MNWHKGNIAEAVALSKTKNAIFVVYVEGKDEATIKLGNIINDKRIREKLESDDFVAIKIESDSESYMQFASIFQIVPVPSIFFIGEAGKPLDIATGVLASIEELEGKIAKVLQLAGKTPAASAINDFIREESKASGSTGAEAKKEEVKMPESKESSTETSEEIVCENGVCFKQTKEPVQEEKADQVEEEKSQTAQDEEAKSQAAQDEEAKLAETRKFLEQKRRERIEEEKRMEKERELRRRKEGKDMQNLCAWQKDEELKELKENIKRERLEEQAARDRIRAQIAADKAERAHKYAVENQAMTSNQAAQNPNTTKTINTSSATASDESRLQFRLASGASNTHNFKCSTTLADIRDYVTREFLPGTGIKEFTLATTYPKRELTNEHNAKTLIELELFPSAVILIIGKEATGPTAIISRNGGLLNMMSVMIMAILNPIFSIFNSAKNWLTGKRNDSASGGEGNAQTGAQKRAGEEQNDVSKRRNLDRFLSGGGTGNTTGTSNPNQGDSSPGSSQGGATRRYVGGSNIHRLSDNRKDSDDENATWNGNSTQQQ